MMRIVYAYIKQRSKYASNKLYQKRHGFYNYAKVPSRSSAADESVRIIINRDYDMESNHKVTIIVAVIALVGLLSTAIIGNWDKISPINENDIIVNSKPGKISSNISSIKNYAYLQVQH